MCVQFRVTFGSTFRSASRPAAIFITISYSLLLRQRRRSSPRWWLTSLYVRCHRKSRGVRAACAVYIYTYRPSQVLRRAGCFYTLVSRASCMLEASSRRCCCCCYAVLAAVRRALGQPQRPQLMHPIRNVFPLFSRGPARLCNNFPDKTRLRLK